MFRLVSILFLLFTTTAVPTSTSPYSSELIDASLKENANAVVRDEIVEISVEAIDKIRVFKRRTITILNKQGDRYSFTGDFYSKDSKIKDQSLVIYDKKGAEVKRYKKKQFSDRSAVDDGTLYSDNRVSYAEFTPHEYPYTFIYESEVEYSSSIFLQAWEPVKGFYVSVENSAYIINNPANIELRYKEQNLEGLEVQKEYPANGLIYRIKNVPATKYEPLSPPHEDLEPKLSVALNDFSLMGVKGRGVNWSDHGKWQYENLLKGRNLLPEATVKKINSLTANAKDDVEKARIIYDYVQQNSRYISVQLGIGGWEPIPAAEVDNLKYGDCKGLTNYTKALLDSQNIPSYYAVVYAGDEKKDIDAEFASMQGNHVILNLPQPDGEDIWLECTSQTLPFNYLGDFTDDRNVLLVKPEGGEIVRTKNYTVEENLKETSTRIYLTETGDFTATVEQKSMGIPYGDIYRIAAVPEKDQIMYYKKNWGHLKNLTLEKPVFTNDRDGHQFIENINFTGEKYASKAGTRLLLPLNFFLPRNYSVPSREGRKLPLTLSRGMTDLDVFEFILPDGFEPEAIPGPVELESRFGSFSMNSKVEEREGKKVIVVNRSYVLNEGTWPAESHGEFHNFMSSIHSLGNQKAVIARSH